MSDRNVLLVCLYCADTMESPSQEVLEKFGRESLTCCDHQMSEVNMDDMYKVVRSLDTLKEKIEAEMIKGL